MQGRSRHNTFTAQFFYPNQMFNANNSEHIYHEDARYVSSVNDGNRRVAIDLNFPSPELLDQAINLNEAHSDSLGDFKIDREIGVPKPDPPHIQLFGRTVIPIPNSDQHQQGDILGSSISYPDDNSINHEHLRFQNRTDGGIAVQETSSIASQGEGSYSDLMHNVLTGSYLSRLSASQYPVFFWPFCFTIEYVEAAVRNLQYPVLPIYSMERYGVSFPNIYNEAIRLGRNNLQIQFNEETVVAINGTAAREVLETRVEVAESAQNFVGGDITGQSFEVDVQPFFPETQENFAAVENAIAEEDYVEEEDGFSADSYFDVTEHPPQEEETEDDVRIILDNSTFQEEFHEEEDYDREEDMELDVDDMTYEELLALEQQIGNVSTGLSETDIYWRIKWYRHITPIISSPEEEDLCGICLDEYIQGQDIGELDCDHKFHHECVKKWLMQKNTCPMCKRTALAN